MCRPQRYFLLLFSCWAVSDLLWSHWLQHTRLPCPLLSPRACSNSCPSSRWCHPTISSSVVPFSSCPQSLPASWSFPMSQLLASGGQSIGVSASASVLPMNIQCLFPLGLTGLISLQSKGFSRVFSNTTIWKHQFFGTQPSLQSTLTSMGFSLSSVGKDSACNTGDLGSILGWIKVKRNVSLLQLPHNTDETVQRSKLLKL